MSNPTTGSGKTLGIPTTYKGITYRSRGEARWAYFFDLAGWRYDYEPLDLNGYIPDFTLLAPSGPILVEIKSSAYCDELSAAKPKIEASSWERDALILGESPRLFDDVPGRWGQAFGLLGEHESCFGYVDEEDRDKLFAWNIARAVKCQHCGTPGFSSTDLGWGNRMCSCPENKPLEWSEVEIDYLWAQASNATRWMPRGNVA